jgi:hypothetical protein
MPELIVVEKIDGSPVAWRCSDCRQGFSVRGKLTAQERHNQITAEFKAHIEEGHKREERAGDAAFAARVVLPG